MQELTQDDYKRLLTEVIRKQIAILGPQITLAKAKSVAGMTVDENGNVTAIAGDPQMIMQTLIDQFVQLSGLIVKKTLEPLYIQQQDKTAAPITPPVASLDTSTNPLPTQAPIAPINSAPQMNPSAATVPSSTQPSQLPETQPIPNSPAQPVLSTPIIPPSVPEITHTNVGLDPSQPINAQSGERETVPDIQKIIDEAVKGTATQNRSNS